MSDKKDISKTEHGARTSPLPCLVPCSKCGSGDIYRRFYAEGEDTHPNGPNREGKTTEFVNRDGAWSQPAKKDCLTNCCRCCGFRWDSEPIKPNVNYEFHGE